MTPTAQGDGTVGQPQQKWGMYVDGYNFYYAIKDNKLGWPLALGWCDFEKLAVQHIIPKGRGTLQFIKYFTARVGNYGRDTGELGSEAARQEVWLTAIRKNPKLEVIFGEHHGKYHADAETRAKRRKEKQTDVKLALALAFDAAQRNCNRAILVTRDTDQIPAIREACGWGAVVDVVLPPGSQSTKWRKEFEDTQKLMSGRVSVCTITRQMLETSRLPDSSDAGTLPDSWRL